MLPVSPDETRCTSMTKPLMKPSEYDGSTPLQDYLAHFEIVCELNAWPDVKAAFLATSLRGAALAVLSDLEEHSRYHYPALINALDRRFNSENKAELNKTLLKKRTREKGESLPELAQNLRRLTKYAYPNAPRSMQDILAKDQFLDALDPDMRWSIFQTRPKTLDEALDVAIECEAFKLAENQRSCQYVRSVSNLEVGLDLQSDKLESSEQVDSLMSKDQIVLQSLLEILRVILQKIESVQNKNQSYENQRRNHGNYENKRHRKDLICFKCGEVGHFQRHCKVSRPINSTTSPTLSNTSDEHDHDDNSKRVSNVKMVMPNNVVKENTDVEEMKTVGLQYSHDNLMHDPENLTDFWQFSCNGLDELTSASEEPKEMDDTENPFM
ncbi:uncharacterized protein [Amphiura filiformis]|uniref:uncharacterized protein n=1 Tax=Amphiura filiformis TaxID=82378 RepID=UPI003B214A63